MNLNKKALPLIALLFLSFGLQKSIAQCYELVWSDEFDYTGFPNPSIWNMEVGNNNGNNNEKQYYTQNDPDNCYVDSGRMVITALKENFGGQAYTSARINTKGKATFMYGKVEARLKLPYGQGIWPAFWMLGVNIDQVGWPKCGEIDIMELIGGAGDRDRTSYGTPHWADANGKHAQFGGSKKLASGKFADDYHIFSIEWTPLKIAWLLDGVQFHVMSTTPAALSEFQQKHFIILNLAVGGSWPGYPDATTVFPQKFEVDYVRVFKSLGTEEIQGKDSALTNEKGIKYGLSTAIGREFLWSVPEGATLLTRADSSEVLVDWGCTSGDVVCNVSTSCTTPYSFSKTVNIAKPQIEGPLFFGKSAGNLFFFLPDMNQTKYKWVVPADASIVSDDTSARVEVKWGVNNGLVNLQVSNACGSDNISKEVFKYGQYPYPDIKSPFLIPGTINSTDYDYGGEEVSYHDTGLGNQGTGGPREDEGVDTQAQPLYPSIGYIATGEWWEYTIKVPQPGYYKIAMKVASQNTTNIGPIKVLINGESRVGDITVPPTGSWTTFVNVYQRLLYLNASDTVLRIQAINGGFNLGPVTFTVDNSLAVQEIDMSKEKTTVFPNPVNDFLDINLNLNSPGDMNIRILDILGKTIFTALYKDLNKGNQKITITEQIKSLHSGIYLIEISTTDQKYFSKFLKN